MAEHDEPLLSGLPERARRLLAAPPLTEKMLLELAPRWRDLPAPIAPVAAAVRLFVITWDPLERLPNRPEVVATSNGSAADLEIVIYLPTWSMTRMAASQGRSLAEELSRVASWAVASVVRNIEQLESGRSRDAAIPDLPADRAAGAELGQADISLISPAWEPIGLGAITDVVQHAFGVVELDRSPVELAPVDSAHHGCPACSGQRFGFIAGLAEARPLMCASHSKQAQAVINRRLARANASNPRGWAAIIDATTRLDRPHLPNGLATRLGDPETSTYDISDPAEPVERAEAIVEAAEWFVDRAEDFAVALGDDPRRPALVPAWTMNLIGDLGSAGRVTEAVQVGDALGRIAPERRQEFESEIAVALAAAGDADQARARTASNLRRWPDDLWVRVAAGDAMLALSDTGGAQAHYQAALQMAAERDDFEAHAAVMDRIIAIRRVCSGPAVRAERHQPQRKPGRAQRTHHKRAK